MLPLGSVPNFFGSFCASIRARRYSEFYPLNVSLLAMRAFGRNNFPLPKKIFRISWKRVSCIALFFLEINSIFFCRKEISLSSFGNTSFLIFAKRQIFLLKETAFDCIFSNFFMPILRRSFGMKFVLSKRISRIPV